MTKRQETNIQQNWMQKMVKVCLAFLVILILFSDSSEARRREVDCTRYVFHPSCRGVAAKRSQSEEFVLDPRSSLNEVDPNQHFISNGPDDDFLEFSEDDFGGKKQSQPSQYDLGLAAKLWPHIQKALLGKVNREVGSNMESFSPQKRSNNDAKLDKWGQVLQHLLEQQDK